ncbi:MAG: hypothetical protein CSB55_04065 [Candidatus Cloacimonadota bacterium]|nr:MAG: hypothetical protein CSB55_04065 [Candidatus Cloacimonadota bacterium]
MSNLLKRTGIAVVFIPLLIWIIWSGGIFLSLLLSFIGGLIAYELLKMMRKKNIDIPLKISFYIFSFILFATCEHNIFALFTVLFAFFTVSGKDAGTGNIENSLIRTGGLSLLFIYPGLFLISFFKLRSLPNGEYFALLLLALIWITDTFAYFTGMTFGKHRGIFKVSPKKSLEGFIGGFSFAFIGAITAHYFFPLQISLKIALIAAFSAGAAGQFGDLAESVFKRDAGVKDSSNLIPGHGGFLDRFDSLLIASPVFYCITEILTKGYITLLIP